MGIWNKGGFKLLGDEDIKRIKQAIKSEFCYRAKFGRVIYSMEEVLYITNEVLDDMLWEDSNDNNWP